MIRELTADEVEFTVECHPEECSIEGNACAHEGCDECHDWIRDQLDSGNEWAWCSVRVVASWNGHEGDAWLGCCSYEGKKDFIKNSMYYDDMKQEALDDLNGRLAHAIENLAELLED